MPDLHSGTVSLADLGAGVGQTKGKKPSTSDSNEFDVKLKAEQKATDRKEYSADRVSDEPVDKGTKEGITRKEHGESNEAVVAEELYEQVSDIPLVADPINSKDNKKESVLGILLQGLGRASDIDMEGELVVSSELAANDDTSDVLSDGEVMVNPSLNLGVDSNVTKGEENSSPQKGKQSQNILASLAVLQGEQKSVTIEGDANLDIDLAAEQVVSEDVKNEAGKNHSTINAQGDIAAKAAVAEFQGQVISKEYLPQKGQAKVDVVTEGAVTAIATEASNDNGGNLAGDFSKSPSSQDDMAAGTEFKVTEKDSSEFNVLKSNQGIKAEQGNLNTSQVGFKGSLSTNDRRTVIDQVSLKLENAGGEGVDKINIKLFPPKLGSVEVRVEMPASGQAKLFFTADKIETLHVLKQEVQKLEQALQRVGIETGSTPQFDLKGENQPQPQEQFANTKFYSGMREGTNEVQIDDIIAERYLGEMDVYDFFGLNNGIDIRA
jgi:flagellar hook-length control protein FliK